MNDHQEDDVFEELGGSEPEVGEASEAVAPDDAAERLQAAEDRLLRLQA